MMHNHAATDPAFCYICMHNQTVPILPCYITIMQPPTQPPMLHLHAQSCATASTPNHILPIHNDSFQPSSHVTSTSTTMQSQPPNAQPDKSKSPNAHNPGSFHPTIVHMHHQAVINLLWSTCSRPYSSQPPTLCLYICMHNQEAMRLQF